MSEQPIDYEDEQQPEPEEAATETDDGQLQSGASMLGSYELQPETTGAPNWVLIPPDFKFPRGRQILFLRFPAKWTATPSKGHEIPGEQGLWRQCICWEISTGDKKLAVGRAMNDVNRLQDELTRQMVRAIDGVTVDHTGGTMEGNLDVWWAELGERCRATLTRIFVKLHVLDVDQTKYFLEHCVAARTAG